MKTAAVATAPPLAETERARRPFVAKVNPNYQKLPGSYLFSEIARRTAAYSADAPGGEAHQDGHRRRHAPAGPGRHRGDARRRRRTWPSPRPSTATALSRATISCAPPSSSAISMRPGRATSPTTRSSSPTAQSATAATSATSWTLTTWWPCATRCIPCMWTPTPWPAARATTTRPAERWTKHRVHAHAPPRTAFCPALPEGTCGRHLPVLPRTTPPARCSMPSS